MATFTSTSEYRKSLNFRLDRLKKNARLLQKRTATRIVKKAKKLAPVHTGKTKQGIRKRKLKDGWNVVSWVPGKFKQNLFANRSPPYKQLVFKKTNRYYKGGQKVKYGGAAQSPSGKQIRWTGKPAFFDLAVRDSIPTYRNEVKKLGKKSLKV